MTPGGARNACAASWLVPAFRRLEWRRFCAVSILDHDRKTGRLLHCRGQVLLVLGQLLRALSIVAKERNFCVGERRPIDPNNAAKPKFLRFHFEYTGLRRCTHHEERGDGATGELPNTLGLPGQGQEMVTGLGMRSLPTLSEHDLLPEERAGAQSDVDVIGIAVDFEGHVDAIASVGPTAQLSQENVASEFLVCTRLTFCLACCHGLGRVVSAWSRHVK